MEMLTKELNLEAFPNHRILVLPSGIGEFQWVWTKMFNVPEKFVILAVDGAPRRLHQFAALHPQVEAFGWTSFDYSQIRGFQNFHELTSWDNVTKLFGLGQPIMLACNPFLEAGGLLADWMPDLPTTYNYSVELQERHFAEASRVIRHAHPDDLLIGISCASYRGAAAWRTWEEPEWKKFLFLLQRKFPKIRFVFLGGAWDDLTVALASAEGLNIVRDSFTGTAPVGTLSFGGTMALVNELDGYIGFSSGLGHVAAHLCKCPTFMLWPEHEQILSKTWCDPEILESGFYVPSRWLEPEVVYKAAELWLEKIQGELWR